MLKKLFGILIFNNINIPYLLFAQISVGRAALSLASSLPPSLCLSLSLTHLGLWHMMLPQSHFGDNIYIYVDVWKRGKEEDKK